MGGAAEQIDASFVDKTIVSLRSFSVGYGHVKLLENVDAGFDKGTLTALLGRNGTGKSTLLRAMAGLGPYKGSVMVGGHELNRMGARHSARMLAFVSTEKTRIAALKCFDIVAMGRAPYTDWIGRMTDADMDAVYRALESVGMGKYASRTADTMSDGECQRVMIARALAQDTPVILLDEPTSFLDLPNRYELCVLLATLAHESDKCIVFSTHELDIAMALSDRIALIDSPELICGDPETMARGGHIARLFDPEGRIPDTLWNMRPV